MNNLINLDNKLLIETHGGRKRKAADYLQCAAGIGLGGFLGGGTTFGVGTITGAMTGGAALCH